MLKRRSLLTTESLDLSSFRPGNPPPMAVNLHLRPHQQQVIASLNRFTILLAHRRFGKTVCAVDTLIVKSRACEYTRPVVHYYAPTYSQAKRIAWPYVHEVCDPLQGVRYSEAELKVMLPWGATLQLGSGDDPDASRGIYSDYVVLDEPAQMPTRLWSEVLRPALSDRQGGALMIGTPKGRHGMFYDSWQYAKTSGDPEWSGLMYRASDTGLIPESELASARRAMSQDEYDQEYECSWDAAIGGAYYAEWMQRAEAEGRITKVGLEPQRPVYMSLDIGVSDSTAAWFFQVMGNRPAIIDYCEFTGMGAPQIAQAIRSRGYSIHTVIAPHDVKVREWGSGETRIQTLRNLGFRVVQVPIAPIMDGIDQVRNLLPRCTFDAEKCREGLECLRHYRSEWQEKNGIYKRDPLHDWSSHGADSFRTLASCNLGMLTSSGGALDYSRMDGAACR